MNLKKLKLLDEPVKFRHFSSSWSSQTKAFELKVLQLLGQTYVSHSTVLNAQPNLSFNYPSSELDLLFDENGVQNWGVHLIVCIKELGFTGSMIQPIIEQSDFD